MPLTWKTHVRAFCIWPPFAFYGGGGFSYFKTSSGSFRGFDETGSGAVQGSKTDISPAGCFPSRQSLAYLGCCCREECWQGFCKPMVWPPGEFGQKTPESFFIWKSLRKLDWVGSIHLCVHCRRVSTGFLCSTEETEPMSPGVNLWGQHLCKDMAAVQVFMM